MGKKEDMDINVPSLGGKVELLEKELEELKERFFNHEHFVKGTRCYFDYHEEPRRCKTGTPELTDVEKTEKVVAILDEMESKGEFDGLTLEEKERERHILGMRLRKDFD